MTTESQSVESHGNNTNPHPVIIQLLNTEKTMLKKTVDLMKHLIFLMK